MQFFVMGNYRSGPEAGKVLTVGHIWHMRDFSSVRGVIVKICHFKHILITN
jgi:hypothetical protein